ncbi:MAG TPA: ATP-binding protein [Acidimicrobiales bacterium]|nr:ATP-binding protein [Acidimicrobiales bacterium]
MARGKLRLYLGAAPGVGKTYAMLNEGWRRKERGTDVIIGWVQDHGRPHTDAQIRDLEILPRRVVDYRGQALEEMDVDGLLDRKPELVLVDELAHSNAPGSKHAKRWQDVEEILDAGINVISTVNLQHLESLNDVVEQITGIAQQETVPDPVVRSADQIELVDMAPEALRRRLAHGNVYPPESIDAALGNYFRTGNLTALRELALLWVADRVDEELTDYRERHNIAGPWETKERVVVSLTGSRGSTVLIRRAARMAMRTKAELVGVHVRTDDNLTGSGSQGLVHNRALLDDLGGRYVEVVGADVAPALVRVAQAENATQLVMGATHRSRLNEFVRGSVINSVIRAASGSLDIHVIATEAVGQSDVEPNAETTAEREGGLPDGSGRNDATARHCRNLLSPLSIRRRVAAVAIGLVGFPLLTLVLTASRSHVDLSTALSSYLVLVVVVAATGGVWPAALAAIAGFLLTNYYFAPPIHTFTIADARDILALAMFLVTAGVVSVLVDLSARRTAGAIQARTDARMLARVAGRMIAPEGNPLPALLGELMVAFRLDGATVLRSDADRSDGVGTLGVPESSARSWSTVASVGHHPPLSPDEATVVLPLTNWEILALRGPGLTAEDREILAAFAAQLATVLERARLHAEAAEADSLARANQLRSALLAAVSHDLRTPLASIKAASSSLLSDQLAFGPHETHILLQTIDDESDRLNSLVENLLDMSRLQTGSMDVLDQSTDMHELIPAAVASLGPRGGDVALDVQSTLPRVRTDPVLLERAVANLIDNALVHAAGTGLRIEVGSVAGRVDIRVIDRGPGIRPEDREVVFRPFQRLGDSDSRIGVGLGLAVARGFVEAVGGELDVEDTPGGGCTMVVRLPAVGPAGGSSTEPTLESPSQEKGNSPSQAGSAS